MNTMNNKKWLCGIGVLFTCFMLTGCHIGHEWQEATCTEPRTCLKGGETEGEPLGHTWVEATCTEPEHCSVCGETEGEPLEHTWVEATCTEPRHCIVCGETEGEPLGHTLTEANYQQPEICTVCGETVGEPLQADFEKYGLECNDELDKSYPYVTTCSEAPEYTTMGNITFSDYEVFSSDDTHPALDGYEWHAVTMTFMYNDENAREYGTSYALIMTDYYDMKSIKDGWDDSANTYTVNYNGVDYPKCKVNFSDLQSGWNEDVFVRQKRCFICIPEKYDGAVVVALNSKLYDQYENEGVYINDVADDDTVFFRLK